MDIGKRIRQIRNRQDLTLEELASRCEVTKGYLSQLENNIVSPSVSTLSDIVEALGTDLSTFFSQEESGEDIFRKEDYFIDEKDDYRITYIVPNAQKNQMEPLILDLEPDGESQEIRPFEGEEFGYVLKGRVNIIFEDREVTVKTGETFYLKGEHSHHLKNETNKIASILWITNPPMF